MSLRLRLTLVATSVVAIVVAAASVTTYFVMRHELYSQVDGTISEHAGNIQHNPDFALRGFNAFVGDYTTVVSSGGQHAGPLPVDARVRAVATGHANGFYRDATVQGYALREIVVPVPGVGAAIVGRDIGYLHHDLSRLRLILILVSLGGIAVAALGGALVSRTTLAPVRRLTSAAERIAKTGDPSERVPEGGRGELSRLGTSFNTMLAALEDAIETQRRFVADASHELRTPLTSMQTNIDVLKQQERLDPASRLRLFEDLQREAHEMRDLIGGLLELARGDDPRLAKTDFRFDELVEHVVERARTRFPGLTFETSLEPTTLTGSSERLERAVWNLLENAGKWSEPGSGVEVTLTGGELRVRDHGPGIAPEDREHVFDRFYRAANARSQPGSGLGLAIVREVAEAHGGTVEADEAPGGGAVLRLRLDNS
jgi:two-component system, OmpR family, sensor histidine kinase MprB